MPADLDTSPRRVRGVSSSVTVPGVADLVETFTAELDRVTAPLRALQDTLADYWRDLERSGRSEALAALRGDIRQVSRGRSALAVRMARVIAGYRARGYDAHAVHAALAFRGDAESLDAFHELLGADRDLDAPSDLHDYRGAEHDAYEVLRIVQDLADLEDDVSDLVDLVADLVAAYAVPVLVDDAPPLPPPDLVLSGSLDRHAPPMHGRQRVPSMSTRPLTPTTSPGGIRL